MHSRGRHTEDDALFKPKTKLNVKTKIHVYMKTRTGLLQFVAVCCRVLQFVAVCCSVLQSVAV